MPLAQVHGRSELIVDFLSHCERGNLAIVKEIAERLGDVDVVDSAGRTGLISAASRNRIEVIAFLLERGADPNKANANGTTPLMFAKTAAFAYGDSTGMKLLINAGANRNARDKFGLTALDYTKERADMIKAVLENYGK